MHVEAEETGTSGAAGVPRVAVCVATLLRPHGLRALLESLAALRLDPGEAELFVVVVDNDAAGSARPVAEGTPLPFPLLYAVEPERNISRARNRGVATALARGCDFVAFVDDDETVDPEWIRELLRARERFGAHVVAGGVRPLCPARTPSWLDQGLFYGAPERRSGVPVSVATTDNVLVEARLLDLPGGPFDPGFGVTGGSDSQLFMRLHRDGARMVYWEPARTYETVPPTRARAGWVLRRAFRVGNTALLSERALERGRPAGRLARATLRLAWGAATLPAGAVRGRAAAMRSLWNVAYGCGAWAGALGVRYREYARLHGE
jgi:glycosyltransferase involved in cell wall biosynthesis